MDKSLAEKDLEDLYFIQRQLVNQRNIILDNTWRFMFCKRKLAWIDLILDKVDLIIARKFRKSERDE